MKYILLFTILVVGGFTGTSQAAEQKLGPLDSDRVLNELASLPEGLTVAHTPDPVYATVSGPSGSQWVHSTTVKSTVGPVTIVEFGYLFDIEGQWIFPDWIKTRFAASDFADWFGCPGAELQPEKVYTDEYSRSEKDCSPDRVARWYFIGEDAQGNRVKGEADIKLLAQFIDEAAAEQGE